jgi:hypothetical protein
MPKAIENPWYELNWRKIIDYIQDTKNNTFIGKFFGIWLTEKELNWWIKHAWKPNRKFYLKLGSKGFFTVIFSNQED